MKGKKDKRPTGAATDPKQTTMAVVFFSFSFLAARYFPPKFPDILLTSTRGGHLVFFDRPYAVESKLFLGCYTTLI